MKYLIPLLIYLNLSIYAQIKDNFSEPNLHNWFGDTNNFVIENQMLKSKGPNSTLQNLVLTRPNTLINDTEWYLSVDLKFNPTASNFIRIYLTADQPDLTKGLNGYFIQFGESNADTMDFYRQHGSQTTKLFTGKTSFANNLKCDLKIVRNGNHSWSFYTRSGSSGLYVLEGSANDSTFVDSQYFGILCQYATASRFDQFYFDNLEIKKTEQDTSPPTLTQLKFKDEYSFLLYFNEAVKKLEIESTGFTASRYTYANADSTCILVNTAESLALGKAINFEIVTATDRYGNLVAPSSYKMICPRKPSVHDIAFTELMVDESPSQGLPEHEYIEIANLSSDFINMQNCYLSDESKMYLFPDSILQPKQYYLLCKQAAVADFGFVQNKIPFTTLPILNNSGKTLKIVRDSTLICDIAYTDKWYHNESKIEGGWSLEVLDSDNFCEEYYNWKPSVSTLGGTPGIINSVQKDVLDSLPLQLLHIDLQVDNTLLLKFNKRLSASNNYSKSLNLSNSLLTSIDSRLFKEGVLVLSIKKPDSTISSLSLQIHNLQDCYGNPMQLDTTFFLPQKVLGSQVLINELLFHAPTHGVEYVELYNVMQRPLNLKGLYLSKRRNDTLYTSKKISDTDLWIMGQGLLLLTEQKDYIINHYNLVNEGLINQMVAWPEFTNDSGTVILHNVQGEIIDLFHYQDAFHNPLIQNTTGVALEKTIPNATKNSPALWKSASEVSGFGTPTQPNSQLVSNNGLFHIHPKVISPDGDGHDDYCTIHPKQETNSDMINIKIIDAEGRTVKTIAQNSNIGTNSFFTWDGTQDNLSKAALGQYLIHIEHYGYGKDRNVERYNVAVFE